MLSESDFQGNERFAVRRRIGAGGMGIVYEVFDHARQMPVALKTLRWSDPQNLYRFKQEFRSLVDIAHPNLVTLYELVGDRSEWLLTMEYIDGVSIIEHVRGTSRPGPDAWIDPTPRAAGNRSPTAPPDFAVLADAIRQLALGTHALHEAGKLHRDIKPSNVLVDRDGRVVLLDFGLVTELGRARNEANTTGDNVVGTATYMSPEQASSGEVGQASDWYSIGVILFEGLTGVLPYTGAPLEVLMDKQQFDAPTPATLVRSVPKHLNELCVRLLDRDPVIRPTGPEIISILGGTAPSRRPQRTPLKSTVHRFVGRSEQISLLRDALATPQPGRPAIALVHGASGMGKSALIARFAEVAQQEDGAQVIVGRCYEAESVPFKALDELIDGLASRLASMPRAGAEAILPRDKFSLSRLFPILKRVAPIADAPRQMPVIDSHELRARATSALCELLGRYAERQPVALVIDDMQWGDVDSVGILIDILRAPDAPALLLVLSFRTENRETSATLRAFFAALEKAASPLPVTEIEVGALSLDEAMAIGVSQLQAIGDVQYELARSIAEESAGNPFFIDALVRYVHAGLATNNAGDGGLGDERRPLREISLDEALRARIDALDPIARATLTLAAVAARRVPKRILYRAGGLEDNSPALAVLRAGHLIRMSGTRGADLVETTHDRLRAAVVATLSPEELAAHHLRLATALATEGDVDPEHLAFHYRGAGQLTRAGEYSADAAEVAFDALAFERAASLYRAALAELPETDARRNHLSERLGDAEWSAGRLIEAAAAYLDAAASAAPGRALDLRRKASEQLLRSVRIEEGIDAVREVLRAVSLTISRTPRQALATLLVRRMIARLRGVRFKRRDASEIAAADLARIDVCWSVASSMGPVDFIRGAALQTLNLLLALKAGEPTRVARALAVESIFSAVGGRRTLKRTRRLISDTKLLNQSVEHAPAHALAKSAEFQCEYQLGNWRAALDLGLETLALMGGQTTGMYFEAGMNRRWVLDCLFNLGRIGELKEKSAVWLRDAARRGDEYLTTELHTGLPSLAGLMNDRPAETRALAEESVAKWPTERYYLQHYTANLTVAHACLYEGKGREAHALVSDAWPRLRRSFLMSVQALETEAWFLRARTAIAASLEEGPDQLDDARRCAKKLSKVPVTGAPALAALVRAMIEDTRGNKTQAIEGYERANELLCKADLCLFAASAQLRIGILRQADDGGAHHRQARLWFLDQEVVDPDKLARVFVPGRTP